MRWCGQHGVIQDRIGCNQLLWIQYLQDVRSSKSTKIGELECLQRCGVVPLSDGLVIAVGALFAKPSPGHTPLHQAGKVRWGPKGDHMIQETILGRCQSFLIV